MKYLVIELKDNPHILAIRKHSNSEPEPIIFEMRQDAERAANNCKQGLVYPIIDIIDVFKRLKEIINKYEAETTADFDLIDKILTELNEIL
jgi:hypothetical protein